MAFLGGKKNAEKLEERDGKMVFFFEFCEFQAIVDLPNKNKLIVEHL